MTLHMVFNNDRMLQNLTPFVSSDEFKALRHTFDNAERYLQSTGLAEPEGYAALDMCRRLFPKPEEIVK